MEPIQPKTETDDSKADADDTAALRAEVERLGAELAQRGDALNQVGQQLMHWQRAANELNNELVESLRRRAQTAEELAGEYKMRLGAANAQIQSLTRQIDDMAPPTGG